MLPGKKHILLICLRAMSMSKIVAHLPIESDDVAAYLLSATKSRILGPCLFTTAYLPRSAKRG